MRDGGVAQVDGIDTLGKQGKRVQKIDILRVVIESESGFDFATANTETVAQPVIGIVPIQRRMPFSQLLYPAIKALHADTKTIRDLRGSIECELSELAASDVVGVHGQPIVVVGVDETLGGIAVELNFPADDFQALPERRRGKALRSARQSALHVETEIRL